MRNLMMRALWICPACRRKFANRNQSHACGRHTLDHHFDGKAQQIRDLFDAFVKAVNGVGPSIVLPQKTRIAFQVRMSFAQLTPKVEWIDGHLVLAEPRTSAVFRRVYTVSARNHVHEFRLRTPADLTPEFLALLREAYAVGQQKHLATAPRKRAPRSTRP